MLDSGKGAAMCEPALSLHIDDQLPPAAAFAEMSDALRDLVAALSEHAAAGPPNWALHDIKRDWDGATIGLRAAVEEESERECCIADLAAAWLDLAERLENDAPPESPESVARAARQLRRVQREQDWTLRFDHSCQCIRPSAVIVPPRRVRLAERRGVVSGPVQAALDGEHPQLIVLDQATQRSVTCYLTPDRRCIIEAARRQFATVAGAIVSDSDRNEPIAMHEVDSVEITPWAWDVWRDTVGVGRWDAQDQAAARLVNAQRESE